MRAPGRAPRRDAAALRQLFLVAAAVVAAPHAATADEIARAVTDVVVLDHDDVRITIPLRAALRTEVVSAHRVDAQGNKLAVAPGLLAQLRLGLSFEGRGGLGERGLGANLEVDVRGAPVEPALEVARFEYERSVEVELRKAYARISPTRWLHIAAGAQTSHWGLGLVANDGAHGWTPGSATFADPVGGDRVLRASVALGPARRAAGLRGVVGFDRVLGDDVMVDGDVAYQAIGAVLVGAEDRAGGGIYAARRFQESASNGRLDVWAIDVAGGVRLPSTGVATLRVDGELVAVRGSTTLAATLDVAEHDVRQFGAALRASATGSRAAVAVDVLFASGDQDIYDDTQQAFRPDPNYELGLLLYRHVLAGQTGRGQANASDPDLVGYPPMGADRIASGGSATNTLAWFSRGLWRPRADLEIYGGPLVALAAAALVDPFQTRISGAARQNALGGEGGTYLGTEVDLGVRHRRQVAGTEMTIGLESGVFVPGDAFRDMSGSGLSPIWGARMILQTRH